MRKTWHEYFLDIARAVATRATCNRKHVGCVLVRDNAILATGYNGSMAKAPHCDDIGHDIEDGHCVRTVHAEANAIAQAAKHGNKLEGATAYVTITPCENCFKLLINAGISAIVYGEQYGSSSHAELAASIGIKCLLLPGSPDTPKLNTPSTVETLSFVSLANPTKSPSK